ncbi:MAG: M3 family metallopeptidase [Pseudomonadota bacterium]
MTNPLLNFDQLPFFGKIDASHVIPALEQVLDEARSTISQLESIDEPGWRNFAAVMEEMDERISRVWSPVSHLNGVQDSDELREAYKQGIELLTAYHSEVSQNPALFQQYKSLADSAAFARLTAAQQKIITNSLLEFRLGGAELAADDQDQLTGINQQLSQLSTQFERNLLDSTQAWSRVITDADELSGLPKSAQDMARQNAEAESEEGWLFNLQIPSYLAIMQHADNAELRREMYQAYVQRASELVHDAAFDNAPIIDEILALRLRKASLLGYENYADYSLVKKMARSSEQVLDFLQELAAHARPVAETELTELKEFAHERYRVNELQAWDISYYSERLREHRYAFNDEQVKPYFPVGQVFDGLFEITRRLFGIEIRSNDAPTTWHDDVVCFDLYAEQDQVYIGSFYADLYARKHKRGGAWMDTCIHRRKKGEVLQHPVAFLTCNFAPPIGETPALLSHDEVETLFHEFGHSLHHLLTQVDEMSVAGINGVAWDAVELPSQFLENWCWHEDSIQLISQHYQTGGPIPTDLLDKMRAAKNFQSGMQTLRQVEFALFDMLLHSEYSPLEQDRDAHLEDVQTLLDHVRTQVAIFQPPAYNRFQNSFGHIFAGGYAAGYYSYKWSEVLSADAFGRFEEEGIFNSKTGDDFLRAILQRGGVDDPNELFFEFRQRAPELTPLLRHSGLIATGNL